MTAVAGLKLVSVTSMKNAEKTAKSIAEGYVRSSRLPDLSVFVLDRCVDATRNELESVLVESGLRYVLLDSVWTDTDFAAGRPRDFAVSETLKTLLPNADVFVFLDGDCRPSQDLFGEHERAHAAVFPYPCLVNSIRVEEDVDGSLIPDPRLSNTHMFRSGADVVIACDEHLYSGVNPPCCIGANISLSRSAIEAALVINTELFNSNRVFAPVFDGQWGGEDPFLATTLFRAGALIVGIDPRRSHVLHHWHPTQHRTNDHVRILSRALQEFKSTINSGKLVVDATRIPFIRNGFNVSHMLADPNVSVQPTRIVEIAARKFSGTKHAAYLLSRVLTYDMNTSEPRAVLDAPVLEDLRKTIASEMFFLSDFQELKTVAYINPTHSSTSSSNLRQQYPRTSIFR